ncbi:CHAD domain-containing protein [Actinophytocola oryzae]|uniref:CHAD domain-containing protein n=1 Tax=Actinophytocola oryzae TaxID=502181 RepID=A0A4V3FSE2_9PSEU|nr:CHAD domain-containing protein [Actinophytocola oryzae]TDV47071.1 CHAD domain-containing protein [Actinophytocola oryzae]
MTASSPPEQTWIDEQVHELRAQAEVALEGADPEGVHQLRVGVRRIRAALRVSGHDGGGALQAELRWFFGELGPLRDLDVLLGRLRDETDGFTPDELAAFGRLLKGLRAERGVARRKVTRALRGQRYERLLADLSATDIAPTGAVGTREVARPFRKLRKAVLAAGQDPADEVLHELRIRGKKLRYAAELMATDGGRLVRRLVKATKRLQDVLGEHQDACVAEDRVRGLVGEDPDEAFVAGRLVERERVRQAQARGEWYAAYEEVVRTAEELLTPPAAPPPPRSARRKR